MEGVAGRPVFHETSVRFCCPKSTSREEFFRLVVAEMKKNYRIKVDAWLKARPLTPDNKALVECVFRAFKKLRMK